MTRKNAEARKGFDDPVVASEYNAWLDERYGPMTDDVIDEMFAASGEGQAIVVPIDLAGTKAPLKAA